jgi:hypothetical protein
MYNSNGKLKENEMDMLCSMNVIGKKYKEDVGGKARRQISSKNQDVYGLIILRCILERYDVVVCTGPV